MLVLGIEPRRCRSVVKLVTGEDVEVAVDIPDVDREREPRAWLPSTSTGMASLWASFTTSLTGTMVPSAFDICVIATSCGAIGEQLFETRRSGNCLRHPPAPT